MTEIINKVFIVPAGKHSSRGASGMDRWENCPGSVQLSEQIQESQAAEDTSEAAEEGTAAHEIAAYCLRHEIEPWFLSDHAVSVNGNIYPVDEDMVVAVTMYVDYIDGLMARYADFEPELHIERHIRHTTEKDVYGTADVFIIVKKLNLLIVVDYKHGKGIIVEPTKPQTKYYSHLVLDLMAHSSAGHDSDGVVIEIDTIKLTIVQPRAPHPQGPIRSNDMTIQQLRDWVEFELKPALARTYDPNAVLSVGDWCRFCRARLVCPEILHTTRMTKEGIKPIALSDKDLLELMERGPAIRKFLGADLAIEAQRRMEAGALLPGWKLVDKVAHREFLPGFEAIAKAKLGSRAYKKSELLSPAQMEKLPGGRELVITYARKPRKGVTIAPASDSRMAVTSLLDQASAFVEAGHVASD